MNIADIPMTGGKYRNGKNQTCVVLKVFGDGSEYVDYRIDGEVLSLTLSVVNFVKAWRAA